MTTPRRHRPAVFDTLGADDAFIALLIAAMDASGHVSAEEAARAHNIIWSMRRFRHRAGNAVGSKIARMRALVEKHGTSPVLAAAARQIPKGLRGRFRRGSGSCAGSTAGWNASRRDFWVSSPSILGSSGTRPRASCK